MRAQPAGRRNKHVTIEQAVESAHDTRGATTKTWSTFATRWAAVLPQSGREYYASNQVHAEMSHLLEMPYLSGLTSAMRIDLEGRNLDIIAVIDLEEKHITHQVVCSEIVGG